MVLVLILVSLVGSRVCLLVRLGDLVCFLVCFVCLGCGVVVYLIDIVIFLRFFEKRWFLFEKALAGSA